MANLDIENTSIIEMDSTFCKVHQNAYSGLKHQSKDSWRGGKNTKIHVPVDKNMHLINVILLGERAFRSEKIAHILKVKVEQYVFIFDLPTTSSN